MAHRPEKHPHLNMIVSTESREKYNASSKENGNPGLLFVLYVEEETFFQIKRVVPF
jgi:hypothetical protein